jgi:3-keto-5-aminohexanoate cleavage enzyme
MSTKERPTFTGEPRKPGGRDPDLCVVTCAVSGVLATRRVCPNIPYTPVEIAEECKRAYDAGAAVVHIHARNDDGSPTFSPAVFAQIKKEVRALNMGTMNYSKYSRARKSFDFDMIFPNTYEKIIKLLTAMNDSGVKPELECFDSGHTNGVWPLLDMGVLRPPLQFSFIVNVLGGIPAHVESLQLQTKIMPPGSEWEVIGISHGAWRMLATALVLGGNVRCGLEDHLYLPSGEMAKSNGELVEVLVRLVRDVGRRPATVEEAREILSLGVGAQGADRRPEAPNVNPGAS